MKGTHMDSVSDPGTYTVYGIYCACSECDQSNPQDIRYVGQSRRFRDRKRQHLSAARSGHHLPVYAWMRKHGIESIRFQVLEDSLTAAVADDRERFWIQRCNTYASRRGLNLTLGGDLSGFRHSEETRRRQSDARKGVPFHTDEFKKAMTERLLGEGNPAAILTWREVRVIRDRYAEGDRPRDIERDAGVSNAVFLHIINNRTWYDPDWVRPTLEEVTELRKQKDPDYGYSGKRMSKIPGIIQAHRDDPALLQSELAELFGVDQPFISRVLSGKRRVRRNGKLVLEDFDWRTYEP